MSEHVESVNAVAQYLRELADKNSDKRVLCEKLNAFARDLDGSAAELVRLKGLTKALPPALGNIHDLPKELLDELSVAKIDEIEDQIVTVINAYGGEASLDQILVGLYRKFEVMQKRRFLQNKLYRMDMVWSVEGKKGVYTITKPEIPVDKEIEDLLGVSNSGGKPDLAEDIPF